jgi:hypothetical protein
METGRGGVETDVAAHGATVQNLTYLISMLVEEASPFQVVEQRMRSHGTKIDKR